jgi:hypothetical protein
MSIFQPVQADFELFLVKRLLQYDLQSFNSLEAQLVQDDAIIELLEKLLVLEEPR